MKPLKPRDKVTQRMTREDDTGEVEARPLDDYLLDEDEPKKEDE